jgi:hypothetical protein
MQHLPGKRVLALVVGLAAATVGSAYAQDTTETGQAAIDTMAPEPGVIDTGGVDTSTTGGVDTSATGGVDTSATRDTTDTSGVQNPPGYRGMERDTTIFPDSGNPSADAGAVEGQTTGTYDDSASQDTSGADTTSADTTSVGDTDPVEPDAATPRLNPSENPAGGDTAAQTPDSTQ